MKSKMNKWSVSLEIVSGLIWASILLLTNLVSDSENHTLFFNILIVGTGIQLSLLSQNPGKSKCSKKEAA